MTGHFLQSKEWEDFQKSLGREVFRMGDVLVIKLPLAFGKSYLYSAGIMNYELGISNCFASIQSKVKQENVVFFKWEPMVEDDIFAQELLKSGFKKSAKEVQPRKTIVLDLTESEEELLAGMHEKTRYNIRVAERKELGIMNYELGEAGGIREFWRLLQKTTARDRFFPHERNYYEKLLKVFGSHNSLFLIHNSKNKTIAANIVLFHGDTAYYLHGASDYKYRNLMGPYLLHWETIRYAQEHDCKKYDFWGIDEVKWPGVTRFKRGFGGREVKYIGSYDYVFQPFWYKLYNLRNAVKKNLR